MLHSSDAYGFLTMCGMVFDERSCSRKKCQFADAPSAVAAMTLRPKNSIRLTASQKGWKSRSPVTLLQGNWTYGNSSLEETSNHHYSHCFSEEFITSTRGSSL